MRAHLFALSALLLAACGAPQPSQTQSMLQQFGSCTEMESYVKDMALESIDAYGSWSSGYWWGGGGWCGPNCMEVDALAGSGPGGASAASDTNVQVEGVDEADIVKNDNRYIFVISGQTVEVLDAWPADTLHSVTSIGIEGQAINMYRTDERLVVFSRLWEEPNPVSGLAVNLPTDYGLSKVTVFDITDPAHPEILRELYLDSWLHDSRRIGDTIYLVSYNWVRGPSYPEWLPAYGDDHDLWLDALRQSVLDSDLDDWVGHKVDLKRNGAGWTVHAGRMVGCSDTYRPDVNHGPGQISVLALSLSDGAEVSGTGLVSNVGTIYSSPTNLYVTESWWGDAPWWASDGEMTTRLHKFHLAEGQSPEYRGSGAVHGWVLDSFSMDERGDTFRVATTDGWWGDSTSSNVFVLGEADQEEDDDTLESEGGDLEILGSVEGLAPGETIYSVRFVDEMGYVVTFERTDPLFSIDLSDPTAPEVVGELEVTGFSNYLHPLGDHSLIGLGDEVDPNTGAVIGMQLSLFDVSDDSDAQLSDRYVIDTGWSWSEAQWDHHAFTWFGAFDVLGVPVVHYTWDENGGWDRGFTGLNVFRITETDGIELLGALDQSSLAAAGQNVDPYYDAWCSQVRRSVFLDDYVFAISTGGVVAAQLSDLNTPVAQVAFEDWGGCYYYW